MSPEEGLRVVFMGTPDVAVPVLCALLDAGHEVLGVYTRPDKRAGRGKRMTPSAVKKAATDRGLPVSQPASLRRDEDARRKLAALTPDVIVVSAYGLFLPSDTLELPPLGSLNVHPSLLPRYRGPSPVTSAILNGDGTTGVTIMKLNEEMDAGPILARRETTIGPEESASRLTERLFRLGADLLVETLPRWKRGEIQAEPQNDAEATATSLLTRDDGAIDWRRAAEHVARQVRAYQPWPGAFTTWRGKTLKIIEAGVCKTPERPRPGTVTSLDSDVGDYGVGVATGDGTLGLRTIQLQGRRAIGALEFVRGYPDFVGSELGK